MPELNGTQTHENLARAFARESQAHLTALWFAERADIDGQPEAAALFRSIAEGGIGHAHGHLEFLADVGDPATATPIGDTGENLAAAIVAQTHQYGELYPGFAKIAREEGFTDIADWFDTVARAERTSAALLSEGLETLR